MQYRTDLKSGNKLSALGLGCMRFPRGAIQIDYKKSEKLVLDAIDAGVNYFDTAYIYMGSEEILGQIFKNNPGTREKIFLATKLPLRMCKSYDDFDKLFNIQLKRLNTDYIDYYFMHNLSSRKKWDELCRLGIEDWIAGKKAEGKIKLAGFSFHGSQSEFFALLDAYDWDFCQIQYNYANIHYQAGAAGLKAAADKGIPVIIMEPLLGGKLATGLPKHAAKLFSDVDASKTPAAWALNWLWDQPEATVVLSGMNTPEQLKENASLA
ncbi:MAG: aldo/keto reductase, partial [Oscillospiraceae bacterium]|nr:aldo/keto reductase [Oscillospiraceae bacterium]